MDMDARASNSKTRFTLAPASQLREGQRYTTGARENSGSFGFRNVKGIASRVLGKVWDGTGRGAAYYVPLLSSRKNHTLFRSTVGISILVLAYMLVTVCFVLGVSSWWESLSQ